MPSLIPQLLPTLRSNRVPGFSSSNHAFYPYYDRLSLANLPASVCHWLGIPAFGQAPLRPELLSAAGGPFRRVVLVVVDGLGLGQLEYFIELGKQKNSRLSLWPTLLSEGMLAPLTSVVPSTTTSALTTLWTGRTPAEHGVMGYEMYLKEYSLVANMILHTPASYAGDVGGLQRAGFKPETFLPVGTLGPHLAAHGVQCSAFQHLSIARSGLSSMLFPQVNVIPFRTLSDLWVSTAATLQNQPVGSSYTYIYWGDLDDLCHRYGPQDRRVELEFASFSTLFEDFIHTLRRGARGDTLLLLTADHGHLHTPANADYELSNHPALSSCLHLLPSGENRLAYLFLRPGKEQQCLDYINRTWPGKFDLMPSSQVISSGLFGGGTHHPRLADRLGDWVMFAAEDAYLWWAAKENTLRGRHGGLSRTEMLIPLLGVVI